MLGDTPISPPLDSHHDPCYRDVTLWYKWNDTLGSYEYSHTEQGHSNLSFPCGICFSPSDLWKREHSTQHIKSGITFDNL